MAALYRNLACGDDRIGARTTVRPLAALYRRDDAARQSVEAMLARYAAEDSRIQARHGATKQRRPRLDGRLPWLWCKANSSAFLDPSGNSSASTHFYEVVKRLNRNPSDRSFLLGRRPNRFRGTKDRAVFQTRLESRSAPLDELLRRMLCRSELPSPKSSAVCVGIFAPSQNYDLALRAVEQTDRIVHIPEVLSHRRHEVISSAQVDGTTERDRQSARAIDEALRRRGESGTSRRSSVQGCMRCATIFATSHSYRS